MKTKFVCGGKKDGGFWKGNGLLWWSKHREGLISKQREPEVYGGEREREGGGRGR